MQEEDDEDQHLWQQATKGVTPLHPKATQRVSPPRKIPCKPQALLKPEPIPKTPIPQNPQHLRPAAETPFLPVHQEASSRFKHSSVPAHTLKRLAKGTLRVEAFFDLHGLNQHEAQAQLAQLLQHSLDKKYRVIEIIHGKGLGVIKNTTLRTLHESPQVLAYTHATAARGGSGCVWVLLRKK